MFRKQPDPIQWLSCTASLQQASLGLRQANPAELRAQPELIALSLKVVKAELKAGVETRAGDRPWLAVVVTA